jgi:hypothetical protein
MYGVPHNPKIKRLSREARFFPIGNIRDNIDSLPSRVCYPFNQMFGVLALQAIRTRFAPVLLQALLQRDLRHLMRR